MPIMMPEEKASETQKGLNLTLVHRREKELEKTMR